MGTNYYLKTKNKILPCEHCGTPNALREEIHIGKSSYGWCFALHVYIDEGELNIPDLENWKELFDSTEYCIENEYGDKISAEEMIDIITNRRGQHNKKEPSDYGSWEAFYKINDAEPGPNNLVRSKISERCIGHGEGTWDLFIGEFS